MIVISRWITTANLTFALIAVLILLIISNMESNQVGVTQNEINQNLLKVPKDRDEKGQMLDDFEGKILD